MLSDRVCEGPCLGPAQVPGPILAAIAHCNDSSSNSRFSETELLYSLRLFQM